LAVADSILDIGPLARSFAEESINAMNKISKMMPLLPQNIPVLPKNLLNLMANE
jgi:hypothetical protein